MKVVEVQAGAVALGPAAHHGPPKLPVAKRGLGDDIQRLLRVAVVETRKTALFALLVKYLDPVDGIGGQVFEHRVGVGAEEWLAIYEHLLHLLALRLGFARGIDRDARHLANEVAGRGVGVSFEGFRVEAGGVAALHGLHFLARHDDRFEGHAASLQRYVAQRHGRAALRHRHRLALVLVADVGSHKHVAARRYPI